MASQIKREDDDVVIVQVSEYDDEDFDEGDGEVLRGPKVQLKCDENFDDSEAEDVLQDDGCRICPRVKALNTFVRNVMGSSHTKVRPYSCVGCEKSFSWEDFAPSATVAAAAASAANTAAFANILDDVDFLASSDSEDDDESSIDGDEVDEDGLDDGLLESGHLQCKYCDAEFKDKTIMIHHVTAFHEDELRRVRRKKRDPKANSSDQVTCDICQARIRRGALRTHQRNIHGKIQRVECPDCDAKFSTKRDWKIHMKKAHNQVVEKVKSIEDQYKQYACELCDCRYYNSSGLKRHKELFHSEPSNANLTLEGTDAELYTCAQCNATFNDRALLTRHINATHGPIRTYTCDLCNEEFRSKETRTKHKRVVHNEVRNFKCRFCKMPFHGPKEVRIHMIEQHHASVNNQCDLCGKKFTMRGALWRHVAVVHDKMLACQCEHCGKNFSRPEYLRSHKLVVHDKIKLWQCEICGKNITTKLALERHLKNMHNTDINERQPGVFKGYTRDFSRPQPYECTFCQRRFTQENNMKRHVKVYHEPDENGKTQKPFRALKPRDLQCPLCHFACAEKSNLGKHMKRVHLKDSCLDCDVCGKKFILEHNLRWHLKKFHNIIEQPPAGSSAAAKAAKKTQHYLA